MNTDQKGRDLFIVDNSISGWTGLRYLEEWTGIAKSFDIATGYFEIGSLLALEGKWQGLEKLRILMGAETTQRTRKAMLDAVRQRAVEILDSSVEAVKDSNPFLHGVPAILEALRSRQIECRVYDKDKFHAKAYITHAKLEVVGSSDSVLRAHASASPRRSKVRYCGLWPIRMIWTCQTVRPWGPRRLRMAAIFLSEMGSNYGKTMAYRYYVVKLKR